MRITLVQAEIELALRAYVLSQISVREGQEITVTFKNTRGDDGATAEIDISMPNTNAQVTRPRQITLRVEPEVKKDTSDPSSGSPVHVVEPESDTTVSQEKAPVQDASTTSEAEDTDKVENQKEKRESVSKSALFKNESGKDEVTSTSSKSLFSNLTRPVNPKSQD